MICISASSAALTIRPISIQSFKSFRVKSVVHCLKFAVLQSNAMSKGSTVDRVV